MALQSSHPELQIIVLSSLDEEEVMTHAIAYGGCAIILRRRIIGIFRMRSGTSRPDKAACIIPRHRS